MSVCTSVAATGRHGNFPPLLCDAEASGLVAYARRRFARLLSKDARLRALRALAITGDDAALMAFVRAARVAKGGAR